MKMSDSSSESQDEAVTYTKGKKLKRTAKSMRLMISDEETKYRNKKFKNVDVISDHGDKLQCTKCLCSIKSSVVEGRDVYSHPLLKVLLCKKCIDYYGNGDFSLDEDDEDKYCRWCGEGGTLFLCSKCICGFCPKCIKKHFGKEKKKLIENDDDWTCFFCKPDWLYDLRAICALALDAANKNKKELRSKRESKLTSMTKKGASTRAKPGRRSVRTSSPNTSTSEKGNSSEPAEVILSSTEEEKPSEKEKNKTPKIALKRKRGSKGTPKVNGKASGIDTLSEGTESDGRGTKKRKASPKVASPVKPTPKPKEKDAEPKKKKVESDSSSESEGEAATTITAPSKQVAKSLGKLTDLFKLTEMTAQLCLDVCKKHLKKLENKNIVVTNEKLIKESEKLKSVVTMLSTNLTTVSSTVSSLQNKLGVDARTIDVANLFSDYSDDSVRGLFALILRGMEVNQPKVAEAIKSSSPAKATPVKTFPVKTSPVKTSPVKTSPKKEPEPKTEKSPKKPEKMEVDEEEPVVKPAEEQASRKEDKKVEVKIDEPEPETEANDEKKTEQELEKSPGESKIDEKEEEEEGNSEKVESVSSKEEDMFSALEAIFSEDGKKKKEEAIVNGDPEKSPGKTDEISLKILTQVDKSNLNDLESASTSKGIEGTVAD